MVQLLSKYSLSEIIIVIILFALSLKTTISFFDWAKERIKKFTQKDNQYQELKQLIQEETKKKQEKFNLMQENMLSISNIIKDLYDKINLLISSDRDDIKSFITREYNYFVLQKGEIDHYSLEAIEKRYAHYVEEGGNSFVGNMMIELRKLPRKIAQ